MPGRQPILRGTGQSDADMMGFNILNVGAVGDIQSATLIVEPGLAVAGEVGERGSGLPFSSISAAVAAAQIGDTIFLRPGTHAFDGTVDIFHLDGLKIIGYGAIITSLSEVNEDIKFTIRSSDVTIEGVEFDGGFTAPEVPSGEGCITVSETGFTLRNCYIHDQNGYGLHLSERWDGARILDCHIQTCSAAIFGEADVDDTQDTEDVWVNRCKILHNRSFGVAFTGPGPDSGQFIRNVQIKQCDFSTNDTENNASPAIACTFACREIQIHDNTIRDESSGIYIGQCKNISISGNYLKGIAANAIWLIGDISVKINDNLIDSRNSAGSPATNAPILIAGSYTQPNDAAQFVITNNALLFGKTSAVAISVSNVTSTIINSNRIEGNILLAACVSVMVNGNQFNVSQTSQAILIDASDRASSKFSVIGNRFNFSGASIGRVIATVDAGAFGIDDILIEANASPIGQVYGNGTYTHSGGNAATRVTQIGNTPESATVTAGWANQGVPVGQVLVSQSRGSDATGARQSRSRFRTIGAAMTAATSGDIIVVEDGTFNELIDAKAGVFTINFLPSATLLCSTAGGCIRSTATAQFLRIHHEHAAIQNSQSNTATVSWTHTGSFLYVYGPLYNSGTGGSARTVLCTDGTIELFGSAVSSASQAIALSTGSPVVHVHGGLTINPYDIFGNGTSVGVLVSAGEFVAENAKIYSFGSAGVDLQLDNPTVVNFKRCTIIAGGGGAGGSSPAISISNPGATVPLLRDCVLVAAASATQSIIAGSAQTILLYGQTVANKGSDPPTNVTFDGGGTYDVDSSVIAD